LRIAREMGDLSRVILGTDAPAGSGVQPLGILRMVSLLSSLGELPAEIAFCLATGNTARMRALDCGIIEVGRAPGPGQAKLYGTTMRFLQVLGLESLQQLPVPTGKSEEEASPAPS